MNRQSQWLFETPPSELRTQQVYAGQSKVKLLTDANFWNIFYDRKKIIVVAFWADWCRACDGVARVMTSIADRYSKGPFARLVKLYHLQWDPTVNPKVYERFGFKSIPVIFFYYTATGRPPTNTAPLLEGSLGGDKKQYDPNQYIQRIEEILRKYGHVSPEQATPPFTSAERNITENDAPQIFRILSGPSPWQQDLQRNLDAHKNDLPRQPMRIVTQGEFTNKYTTIFRKSPSADVQGFVDRRNATIYLKEFPAGNVGKSKVGLALHEAVHLFSHPPGRSNQLRANAYSFLGVGLLEGLTQVITEDIQTKQSIDPLRERWQAYQEYVPVTREFIRIFTPAVIGDAYFKGELTKLLRAIEQRWTHASFVRVRMLTDRKEKKQALQLINSLEKAYLNRPKIREYQWIFR
ncbi:MAG TPA: thioredoxin domain-containing protein [Methylococcales bacterium]